ncbi:MAG: glycosyltransferase, partial [Anaerolineae bacterium]
MKFSVIIPSHNAARTLPACLAALQNQTLPRSEYEIIVVDDASTDETAVIAQKAGVAVLTHSQKKGAGAARNTAVRVAQGEIICFTDADCVPIPAWIELITAPLLADPEIIAAKGAYATHQKEIVARFVQLEYEDKYDRLRTQSRIDFVDTHSAAFRREVLLANDGFDEKIHFAEDRELAYRLAARGYQMVFQPEAVVAHWHTATWRGYFRKKFFI